MEVMPDVLIGDVVARVSAILNGLGDLNLVESSEGRCTTNRVGLRAEAADRADGAWAVVVDGSE